MKKQKTPKPEDVAALQSQLKAAKENRRLTKVTKKQEKAANEVAKEQAASEAKAAWLEAERQP